MDRLERSLQERRNLGSEAEHWTGSQEVCFQDGQRPVLLSLTLTTKLTGLAWTSAAQTYLEVIFGNF